MTQPFNTTLKRSVAYGLSFGVLALSLTACDTLSASQQAAPASAELSAAADDLARELSLSTGAADDLRAAMARYEGEQHTPGYLWYVAAEWQEKLSDEQKASLFSRLDEAREARPTRRENVHRRMQQGRQHRDQRKGQRADALGLSEAQQEQMEAIRAEFKPKMQALMEARRSGDLTQEAFREQARALREEMQAAHDAILTDEQRAKVAAHREQMARRFEERREQAAARRDERQARRDEARDVKVEVLGLTAAQQEALQTLREAYHAERRALQEKVRSGEVERSAALEAARAARTADATARDEILTERQREIVMLHEVLARQIGRKKAEAHHARHGHRFRGAAQ